MSMRPPLPAGAAARGHEHRPDGVHLLRGAFVRRTPTAAELAQRPPLALTARDVQILTAIHTHGFLTTELIELAFFPAATDRRPARQPRRPCATRVYDRLRHLWLWGFLERVERPVARTLGGSYPVLYCLGERGVAHVAVPAEQSTARIRRRRLDRLDHQFIEHDLKAAALWAHLCAALRAAGLHRWSWTGERDLRARHLGVVDPKTRRRLPFLPDGYFEINYDYDPAGAGPAAGLSHRLVGSSTAAFADEERRREGQRPMAIPSPSDTVQACLVEIDMGTLTLRRFRAKVRAFELALAQGLFAREWQRATFEVLAPSAKRLGHLCHTARGEVPRDRWRWYSFASFEVLHAGTFGDYAWQTLDGQHVRLLYDQAFPDEANFQGAAGG